MNSWNRPMMMMPNYYGTQPVYTANPIHGHDAA